MIDLTDSFFEGVKISPKNNVWSKSVPKNNCSWVKWLLIICCKSMDLSKTERVHVTSVSLGFLKICWYLYCRIAMYESYKSWLVWNQCVDFQGIASLGRQACLRRYHMESSCFWPSGSWSLYHFNFCDILLGIGIPYWWSIFNLCSH